MKKTLKTLLLGCFVILMACVFTPSKASAYAPSLENLYDETSFYKEMTGFLDKKKMQQQPIVRNYKTQGAVWYSTDRAVGGYSGSFITAGSRANFRYNYADTYRNMEVVYPDAFIASDGKRYDFHVNIDYLKFYPCTKKYMGAQNNSGATDGVNERPHGIMMTYALGFLSVESTAAKELGEFSSRSHAWMGVVEAKLTFSAKKNGMSAPATYFALPIYDLDLDDNRAEGIYGDERVYANSGIVNAYKKGYESYVYQDGNSYTTDAARAKRENGGSFPYDFQERAYENPHIHSNDVWFKARENASITLKASIGHGIDLFVMNKSSTPVTIGPKGHTETIEVPDGSTIPIVIPVPKGQKIDKIYKNGYPMTPDDPYHHTEYIDSSYSSFTWTFISDKPVEIPHSIDVYAYQDDTLYTHKTFTGAKYADIKDVNSSNFNTIKTWIQSCLNNGYTFDSKGDITSLDDFESLYIGSSDKNYNIYMKKPVVKHKVTVWLYKDENIDKYYEFTGNDYQDISEADASKFAKLTSQMQSLLDDGYELDTTKSDKKSIDEIKKLWISSNGDTSYDIYFKKKAVFSDVLFKFYVDGELKEQYTSNGQEGKSFKTTDSSKYSEVQSTLNKYRTGKYTEASNSASVNPETVTYGKTAKTIVYRFNKKIINSSIDITLHTPDGALTFTTGSQPSDTQYDLTSLKTSDKFTFGGPNAIDVKESISDILAAVQSDTPDPTKTNFGIYKIDTQKTNDINKVTKNQTITETKQTYHIYLVDRFNTVEPKENLTNPTNKDKILEKSPGYVTVTFDPTDKGALSGNSVFNVRYNKQVTLPVKTPVAKNKHDTFKTWSQPTTNAFKQDTTIIAQYAHYADVIENGKQHPKAYVQVNVDPTDKAADPTVKIYFVNPDETVSIPVKAPTPKSDLDIFVKWDKALTQKFTAPTTITAQYQTYPNVIPGLDVVHPKSYVHVQCDPTTRGKANGETHFWVNPAVTVTIPVKDPTPVNSEEPFTGWDQNLTQKFTKLTTITAKYKDWKDVIPGEKSEHPKSYVLVTLNPTDKGTLAGESKFWVRPTKSVTIPAGKVTAKDQLRDRWLGWDQGLTQKFEKATTITAIFKTFANVIPGEKSDHPDGYVKVTLNPTDKGSLEGETIFWVRPNTQVTIPAGKVTEKVKDEPFTRWSQPLKKLFAKDTVLNAQYGNIRHISPDTGLTSPTALLAVGVSLLIITFLGYSIVKKGGRHDINN